LIASCQITWQHAPLVFLCDLFHRIYDVEGLVRLGGIVGLTIIVFTETGLLVGFFLPGDSLLVTAGLFAARGDLEVVPLLVALSLAAIIGPDVRPVAASGSESRTGPPWLRIAHGYSALAILVIFLAPHIANHLTAIWSTEFHKAVMNILRLIYRASLIQTALVGLFLFQITGGMALLWRKIATPNGFIGSLQTASGAYLAAFVTSHLMAVFVLGRWAMQIDTNWDFATGAPTGGAPQR